MGGYIIKNNFAHIIYMRTIRIIGMRRSGNHAIINWLASNFNNGNPVDTFYNKSMGLRLPVFTNNERDIFFINGCKEDPYWDTPELKKSQSFKLMIHSYEDRDFSYILHYSYNKLSNSEDNILNIIIMRDPLNLFASRQQHPESNRWLIVDEDHINLWVKYAEEALNITNNIQNKLVILYNKWLTDKNYRDSIAKIIGTPNFDNTEQVSICGDGSSFIGLQLDKVENYLQRYKMVEFPDHILNLLNSDKVTMLSDQLFHP